MGKVPLKVREGKKTSQGMQPNGSTKGLSRHPELSKRRLLSTRRMWTWRRRGRARCCFFSTRRKGVKRRRPSEHSGPPGDLPGKIRAQTRGAAGRDGHVPGHPADRERGSATAVVGGGGPQAGCEEVCRPASPSTSTPGGCPETPGTGGSGKRRSGGGRADKHVLNPFEKMAGDQEARVCPREARATPGAEQAMADGEAGIRTSPGPVCKSLPGRGVSSERRPRPGVTRGSLIATFNEFLSGFCRVYGSLIPLQKCDIRRSLRWPEMDVRERNMLVISMVTKFRSRVARTPSPAFQVVYKKHTLTLEDLSTLANQNWLNDQVINVYGELIMDSTDNQVHFLNSFFHHQLETKGYEGVRRWTKQVNLFSKRLVLVPVHLEVHWCLVTVDPGHRRVRLYDPSEGTSVAEATMSILKYLTSEAKEKSQKYFQTGWMASDNKEIPKQNNENDCGVFVLEYCKRLAFRKPLTFSQKEIPSIRKTIYKELCERKLHV